MSSMAPLYCEGLPICCLDTPKHVPAGLAVGDHSLVPSRGLVHEAMRLNEVGESEADPENGEVILTQHFRINSHTFAGEKVVFIAAFHRLDILLDWDPRYKVLV